MSETKYTAAVITVSDKGFRGQREDTSGPALCGMLTEQGWNVVYTALVPDEKELIQKELLLCADEKHIALVLTTGGTGFSPRDVTPEATMEIAERLAPGIPEAMRAESMKITPHGCLSRETAGIRGGTLIQSAGQQKSLHRKLRRRVQARAARGGNAAIRRLGGLRSDRSESQREEGKALRGRLAAGNQEASGGQTNRHVPDPQRRGAGHCPE